MKYKLTCIILLIFLISGCVGTVFSGVSAIYDRHELRKSFTNHYIAMQADSVIGNDKQLSENSNISVAVFDYMVLLTGQVQNESEKLRAQTLVSNIKGVKRVFNKIKIGPSASTSSEMYDTWITTKIKSEMIATPDFDPARIKVVTENQSVYLLGVVDHRQARMAVNIAKHTSGVKRVVKAFEYLYRSTA